MEVNIDNEVYTLLLKHLAKKQAKNGIFISPEAFMSLAIKEKIERQQGPHYERSRHRKRA